MQNKSNRLFSGSAWKKLLNWKTLAVLPLLFSAAVHAATCPDSANVGFDPATGHFVVAHEGRTWISQDTYSSKFPLVGNYAEIRMPNGNKDQGHLQYCRYSNDLRQTPRVIVDLLPSHVIADGKLPVTAVGHGFESSGMKVNAETVVQCHLNAGSTSCRFDIKVASAAKSGSVSPFGSAQTGSCEDEKNSAISYCLSLSNQAEIDQCLLAVNLRYSGCGKPSDVDNILKKP